ncbi:MAG: hypothetical protein LBB53_03900, partial [Prevotellaceae bacterium]|nr:hypothetical protein [Prevotellaceae bacterium]
MSKRLKIYLALFAAAIVLLMYLEYTKPKPIDWTKTYSAKDKIPFGAFVLAEELPKLFPDKNIEIIDKQSITTFMIDNDNVLSGDNSTLFILSGNNLYDGNFDYLLDFVKNGNDVFFVTNNFPKSLQDTLKLKKNTFIANIFKKNSYTIYSILCNNYLDTTKYYFKKQNSFSYFFDFDIKNTVVLGQYVCDSSIYTNFIKTSFGNGNFYINLLPEAFTNYYMLNDSTFEYAVNSLNYIKKSNIYFYEYKKSKKVNENESLLMYIFANPPLHWAWLIFIWGMVIYALFAGKRL